ncbi:MAG TPA: sigma-70 family RNA polymerase sigma factor [Solirubrobacteraceae bacterium]|nr:sigma-70 family RNA polymerase sigma factor [Solirubrobacteraceae bacterium]
MIARRYARTGIDIDDIVQETLLRAWRKRGQCRAADDPLPWVGRIAHNEGRRYCERTGREDLRPELEPGGDFDFAAGLLDRAAMLGALESLADGERLVVELRYGQDQTHRAIAGQLGMPVGTVKARLHRARHRLKEALANVDD